MSSWEPNANKVGSSFKQVSNPIAQLIADSTGCLLRLFLVDKRMKVIREQATRANRKAISLAVHFNGTVFAFKIASMATKRVARCNCSAGLAASAIDRGVRKFYALLIVWRFNDNVF